MSTEDVPRKAPKADEDDHDEPIHVSDDEDGQNARAELAKDIAAALHDEEVTVFPPASSPTDAPIERPTPRVHTTPDPYEEPVVQPAHDPDDAPLFQLPPAFQDGVVTKTPATPAPRPATTPEVAPTKPEPIRVELTDELHEDLTEDPVPPADAGTGAATGSDLSDAFGDDTDDNVDAMDTPGSDADATQDPAEADSPLLAARKRKVHQLRFDRNTAGATEAPADTPATRVGASLPKKVKPQAEPETEEEPLNDGVDEEAALDVINHLLWHKALIDERDGGERIEEYLELVRRGHQGEYVAISDPFNKSIALSFQLVLSEHMDPWRIDLGRFSQLYVERAREEDIDLVTAGRVILMAWTVLRMQSEAMIEMAESLAARWDEPEPEVLDWDDIGDWDYDDEDYEYTQRIKYMEGAPLDEKIRRKGAQRKVTLMELVEAFEEARREVEEREILKEERARVKAMLKGQLDDSVSGMVHKEDPEADLRMVWDRITSVPLGGELPLYDIHKGDLDDLIVAFTNVLFLAADRKVAIRQEDFPHGPVYVKRLVDVDDPSQRLPDDVVKRIEAAEDAREAAEEAARANQDPDAPTASPATVAGNETADETLEEVTA